MMRSAFHEIQNHFGLDNERDANIIDSLIGPCVTMPGYQAVVSPMPSPKPSSPAVNEDSPNHIDGNDHRLEPIPINMNRMSIVDNVTINDTAYLTKIDDFISILRDQPTNFGINHTSYSPCDMTTQGGSDEQNFCSVASPNINASSDLISRMRTSKSERGGGLNEDASAVAITADKQQQQQQSKSSGKWHDKLDELRQFKAIHGHCLVPHDWKQNLSLAQWVKRQRHSYKLKHEGQHTSLTDERVQELEELGFVWNSHSAIWEERLTELREFQDKHGHCNVPSNYPPNQRLSVWVKCQRRQYKMFVSKGPQHSSITLERVARLTAMGFAWSARKK